MSTERRASAPLFPVEHPADMSTLNSDAPSTNQQSSTLVDSAELPPTAKSPPKQAFELPSKQIKIEEPPLPTRARPDDSSAVDTSKSSASTMAGRARSGSQRMQALSEKFSESPSIHHSPERPTHFLCKTPARFPRHGQRWRIPTTLTLSSRILFTPRTNHSQ